METNAGQLLGLELLWLIITAIIVAAVVYPIFQTVDGYPFWITNIVFILVFVTFTRYIFLTRYSILSDHVTLKVILSILCIPIIFLLIENLTFFQTFLDEEGPEGLLGEFSIETDQEIMQYIKNEMMFFGVGSVISSILLPFKMIISVWRHMNRE